MYFWGENEAEGVQMTSTPFGCIHGKKNGAIFYNSLKSETSEVDVSHYTAVCVIEGSETSESEIEVIQPILLDSSTHASPMSDASVQSEPIPQVNICFNVKFYSVYRN